MPGGRHEIPPSRSSAALVVLLRVARLRWAKLDAVGAELRGTSLIRPMFSADLELAAMARDKPHVWHHVDWMPASTNNYSGDNIASMCCTHNMLCENVSQLN